MTKSTPDDWLIGPYPNGNGEELGRDDSGPEPVTVVIPAYNEERSVRAQVEAVERVLGSHQIPHEVLVVDDGSSDATAVQALQAGARVLRHAENRGYGAAIKTGIDAAKYEAIVIIDSDGTYPSGEIPALLVEAM